MSSKDDVIRSALKGIMALATVSTVVTAMPVLAAQEMEKCYGVVKAGLNDCQTGTQNCAGSATKDNQGDAFIFLPKGTCDKIVGGSLTAKTESSAAESMTQPISQENTKATENKY